MCGGDGSNKDTTMISGRGRAQGSDRKTPTDRIASPTPSVRPISKKRVNSERESHHLLENDYMTFGYGSALRKRAESGSTSDDEDSFTFRSETAMENSSSVNYVLPNESSSAPNANLGYFPAVGTTSLSWSDLLPYYLPILSWYRKYNLQYFIGDLIGGVSLAAFQIPLAISYSTSLAKVPISCGLYSLGIAPLIYLIFGSVPQMITGPEAPMSLIVGQAVEPLLHHSKKKHLSPSDYVVAITFVSGATLLGFGLGRFGFLDNVLCESLLKGFICGVGAVMIINASITMLGLADVLERVVNDLKDLHIHSPFDKVKFILTHYREYHALTLKVSIISFVTIILIRKLKGLAVQSQVKGLRNLVYFPEILLVVFGTTILCDRFRWNHSGLDIVGSVEDGVKGIEIYNPLAKDHLKLMKTLYPSGFVCAMLGFFESTTALKSLGSRFDLPISSNRELVALGAINVVGAFFAALPAFGGYGRSKINAISAKTTISGAIMGIIALITVSSILEYLHYIPKCILSVITAVIGFLLMSEAPRELLFHWRSRGFDELMTFAITVLTTLFFSMEAGIAVGLVYLLIRVIKNSAESNIQILGRIPDTNTFVDADLANSLEEDDKIAKSSNIDAHEKRISQLNLFTDTFRQLNVQALEEIEGCLIIKIPEPLTFTNASDLRARLKRVEMYGSTKAHPGLKRSRDASMTKYMIFDLEGMSFIDSSAAQILFSSLRGYQLRNIKSFFVRVNKSRRLRERLHNTGITDLLKSDLKSTRFYEFRKLGSGALSRNSKRVQAVSSGNFDLPKTGLTESYTSPYFEHIRSALKLVDHYEQYVEPSDTLV